MKPPSRFSLQGEITSHDLIKTLAIILMIADHIGVYFFPEQLWWRVVGRLSVPVWFFLIGYAERRDVQRSIWIGGAVLALSRIISGFYLFPFSILFTLGLCRLMIDGVMARALKNRQSLWGMLLLLFFLAFPSQVIVEYGSGGVMFAMLGCLVRRRNEIRLKAWERATFALAAALAFIFIQTILLGELSSLQIMVFCTGMLVMTGFLLGFAPRLFPRLTRGLGPASWLIRLCGRRSLEIYVLHLLLFSALALALEPARFALFHFQWVPPALTRFFSA